MKIADLIPWKSDAKKELRNIAAPDSIASLQYDINRAFSDFWRMIDVAMPMPFRAEIGDAEMHVDVINGDKKVTVRAELPGMEEEDIDVNVTKDSLTIRGEKKMDRDVEENGYILRERTFGRIERTVMLPDGVDPDATTATFKSGVLTVTIPKTAEAQAGVKHISVKSS